MSDTSVSIPVDRLALDGELVLPTTTGALVVFVHGSGSSRFSPRNNHVAEALRGHGLGTLLFDLLTGDEDAHYSNRFDIPLLIERCLAVTRWLDQRPDTRELAIGYFGASTGAAAALGAAAERGERIGAVVSRGGRPDLAMSVLGRVSAPTLLIVGGLDHPVIEMNRQAGERLTCEHRLELVPGATHLFEEAGALEEVTRLAADWFLRHLSR